MASITDATLNAENRSPAFPPGASSRKGRRRATRNRRERAIVLATQAAIVFSALAAWEWLPKIERVRNLGHAFDPFFISSPSLVASRLYDLLFSERTRGFVWEYIQNTLGAAILGLLIGLVAGGAAGLVVGNSPFLGKVVRPFVIAFNAIPRIALIPIVVVIMGSTFKTSVVNSILIVFFIAFFNAYEGATTVPPQLVQNARVFRASRRAVMLHVRLPYVLAWTLAALPIAATFSLLAVVTGEILTGYAGLGRMITDAQSTADSTLTFSVVIILSVLGLMVVGVAEVIKRRLLHWWGK